MKRVRDVQLTFGRVALVPIAAACLVTIWYTTVPGDRSARLTALLAMTEVVVPILIATIAARTLAGDYELGVIEYLSLRVSAAERLAFRIAGLSLIAALALMPLVLAGAEARPATDVFVAAMTTVFLLSALSALVGAATGSAFGGVAVAGLAWLADVLLLFRANNPSSLGVFNLFAYLSADEQWTNVKLMQMVVAGFLLAVLTLRAEAFGQSALGRTTY